MTASRRPRIGITASTAAGTTSQVARVGRGYIEGVVAAGGLPVVLPTIDAGLAIDAVAGIDGLLLTGGADVDPARYGADRHAETGGVDPQRDAWELALIDAARGLGLPILAICRGCQVLNVAHGGTLVQHLPDRTSLDHDQLDQADQEVQALSVAVGSRLSAVVGGVAVVANTLHHQAVDRVGDGLRASAWSADGEVEAVEASDEPALGVQWHPELLLDRPHHAALFTWLVTRAAPDAAATSRSSRTS